MTTTKNLAYSDIYHTRKLIKHGTTTQQQLADIFHISEKSVRRYLAGGENCPTSETCRLVRKEAYELYNYRFQ